MQIQTLLMENIQSIYQNLTKIESCSSFLSFWKKIPKINKKTPPIKQNQKANQKKPNQTQTNKPKSPQKLSHKFIAYPG